MPQLFLNERSSGTECGERRANEAMTEFTNVVLAVVRIDKPGTSLICATPLRDLLIAEGHSLQMWIGSDRRNRDAWQRLRLVQNRAPFSDVYPDGETYAEFEYEYDGKPAHGFGAAHLMGGLAISLPVHQCWDVVRVPLRCTQLVEDADAGLSYNPTDVVVRHVSRTGHVDHHDAWIKESARTPVGQGADLWRHREALFPHLQFLPRVRRQLETLKPEWVRPVRSCLDKLDACTEQWDTDHVPQPTWQTHVTPEAETRKRVCRFTDTDGQTRTFDLHARFTPGMGRIHFRLVREEQALRIAHVGDKIRPDL